MSYFLNLKIYILERVIKNVGSVTLGVKLTQVFILKIFNAHQTAADFLPVTVVQFDDLFVAKMQKWNTTC